MSIELRNHYQITGNRREILVYLLKLGFQFEFPHLDTPDFHSVALERSGKFWACNKLIACNNIYGIGQEYEQQLGVPVERYKLVSLGEFKKMYPLGFRRVTGSLRVTWLRFTYWLHSQGLA